MATDPRRQAVRRAFDRAAASYDAAAVLQREVGTRLAEKLDILKIAPRRVLDAGCGTGAALEALRGRYPEARVTALDLAPAMLERARGPRWKARLPFGPGRRSDWLCADLQALPLAAASVDLIWSSLTLQWCADPGRAFAEAHRVLAPGGVLLFSTLGPDTLKELRQASGADGYRHVNRFADMHDLGDLLVQAGFADPVMEMEIITLTYGRVRDLVGDLKALGAQTVLEGGRPGLMGKARWRALEAGYEAFRRDGRLPATWEVVYGHAWRAADRPGRLADGRQVIEFQPRRK